MARETKEVTTPSGIKVVLKTYLNGAESRAVRGVMFNDIQMTVPTEEGEKPTVKQLPAEFLVKQERKKIEFLVESVDGVTANVADIVDEMREIDYNFIKAEIDKIVVPLVTGK